ncbi:hypothetical protein DL96DRAFT_1615343 [Flagelloscypha sp. PMI_526]|nr:hypothetical protein DL96DRAFT_1615343 [Flagelloscypha sp. PMI_526]
MLARLAALTATNLFDRQDVLAEGYFHRTFYSYSVNDQTHALLKECLGLPQRTAFLTDLDGFIKVTNDRIELAWSQIARLQDALHQVTQWKEDLLALAGTIKTIQTMRSEPIPNLPSDILWNIFAVAAEDSKETGSRLSLISKEVQQWVDPILFRHINLSCDEITPAQLRDTLSASPRLSHAVQFTTGALIWGRFRSANTPDPDTWIEFLSQLPSFRALSLMNERIESQETLDIYNVEIPKLRHLFLPVAYSAIPFNLPLRLFASITHLALDFSSLAQVRYDWRTFSTLEHIQILAIDLMGSKKTRYGSYPSLRGMYNVQGGIARIQDIIKHITSPALHTVLWREFFSVATMQDWRTCAEAVTDPRLIICVEKLPLPARLVNGGLWPFLDLKSNGTMWSLGLQDHVQMLRKSKMDTRHPLL